MPIPKQLLKLYWKFVHLYDADRLKYMNVPEEIVLHDNIPYIDDGTKEHMLEICYPENPSVKLPVVIDIHGGGWMYGDKELNRRYCTQIAAEGYAVVGLNYRLAPKVTVREQLCDIVAAFHSLYDILGDYPCDLSKVYLTGDSAGGQLAAYSAILNSDAQLGEIVGTSPSRLDIRAVGLVSAVCFMEEDGITGDFTKAALGDNYKDTPFGNYVNLDDIIDFGRLPPTFIVTSSGDGFGLEPSIKAYELIKSRGIPCELLNWEKTNGKDLLHVFSVLDPEAPESVITIKRMLNFFNNYGNTEIV